jgi:hypothetical protein
VKLLLISETFYPGGYTPSAGLQNASTGLHDVTSLKVILFVATAVRISYMQCEKVNKKFWEELIAYIP